MSEHAADSEKRSAPPLDADASVGNSRLTESDKNDKIGKKETTKRTKI